jgi:hypothetical protein
MYTLNNKVMNFSIKVVKTLSKNSDPIKPVQVIAYTTYNLGPDKKFTVVVPDPKNQAILDKMDQEYSKGFLKWRDVYFISVDGYDSLTSGSKYEPECVDAGGVNFDERVAENKRALAALAAIPALPALPLKDSAIDYNLAASIEENRQALAALTSKESESESEPSVVRLSDYVDLKRQDKPKPVHNLSGRRSKPSHHPTFELTFFFPDKSKRSG